MWSCSQSTHSYFSVWLICSGATLQVIYVQNISAFCFSSQVTVLCISFFQFSTEAARCLQWVNLLKAPCGFMSNVKLLQQSSNMQGTLGNAALRRAQRQTAADRSCDSSWLIRLYFVAQTDQGSAEFLVPFFATIWHQSGFFVLRVVYPKTSWSWSS